MKKQRTIFRDSTTGAEVFTFDFLYETALGKKITHQYTDSGKKIVTEYEIVDILHDLVVVDSITVVREISIYNKKK